DVKCLRTDGEPGEPRKNARISRDRDVLALEDEERRAFAEREPCPAAIEGPTETGIRRAERVESGQRQPAQAVGSPGEHAFRGPALNPRRALHDGVRAARARAADGRDLEDRIE